MLGYYLASRIFSPARHIDALVLSPPTSAPDQPLPLARELYHRHLAYLLARRYQRAEWLLMGAATIALIPMAAIHGPGTGASLYAIPLAICGAILAATHGGQALTRWLCRKSRRWTEQGDALYLVKRTLLREPRGAPEDLADPWRHGWITQEGRPLSAEICEVDTRQTVLQKRGTMWLLTSATAGLLLFGLLASPLTALAGITGLGVARLILDPDLARQRARLLDLGAAKTAEGAAWAYGGGTIGANRADAARGEQLAIAIRDKSPLLTLAECLGLLSARGNPLSPSAGRPMQISIDDLMQHLIVFGGVGSGKTSGILRPLLLQLGKLEKTGIIVMDAKGALPYEVQAAIPSMTIIEPSQCEVSLVAGLTPTEIVSTIVDILAPNGGSDGSGANQDRFFVTAASNLLRYAAVIANRLGGAHWTLAGIYQIARTGAAGVLDHVDPPDDETDEKPDDPELAEAVTYFRTEYAGLDPKTRSSILATAGNWYGTITAHPDGLRWAETGDDEPDAVDVLSVLTGGRVGILAPSHKYGKAGPVLLALLKSRISAGIRDRAGRALHANETPVVMVIDEAQDVATSDDADTLAIARSLGLAVVAATQTVEGVESRLGKAASKWLNIFGSVIALANRSKGTDTLISERMGAAYGAHLDTFQGVPDVRSSVVAQNGSGSLAGGRHQQSVRDALAGNDSGIIRTIIDKVNPFRLIGNAVADAQGGADKGTTSKVGTRSWVAEEEVQALVCEPDTALAVVNRARVPRADLVRLRPVYATAATALQTDTSAQDTSAKPDLTLISGAYREAADD